MDSSLPASLRVSVCENETPLPGQAEADGSGVIREPVVAAVWKMFQRVSGESGCPAKCLVPGCPAIIQRAASNTTSMMRHLKQHQWERHYCIEQGKTLEEALVLAERHHDEEYNSRQGGRKRSPCNEMYYRELLVRYIVSRDISFMTAESPEFRELVRSLNREVRCMSCMSHSISIYTNPSRICHRFH